MLFSSGMKFNALVFKVLIFWGASEIFGFFLAESEAATHEVHGHSNAPVYKIDFGLLTLICYHQALQHLVMLPSVSTLGQTGFESWQNVFKRCCVWTQRTQGLLTKTPLAVRGQCKANERLFW